MLTMKLIKRLLTPFAFIYRRFKEIVLTPLDKLLIISSFFLLGCWEKCEQLIDVSYVSTYLSKFEGNKWSTFIFAAYVLFVLGRLFERINGRVITTFRQVFYWVIIACIVAYYRFVKTEVWLFASLNYFESIKYIDIVFIHAFSTLVTAVLPLVRPKKSNHKGHSTLIFDQAIQDEKDDLLFRSGYAKSIANDLLAADISTHSAIIAIQGPWGSGKTSFVSLLKRQLTSKNNVVLMFNPWCFDKRKSIASSFYSYIHKELKKHHKGIGSDLTNYFKLFFSNEKPFLGILSNWFNSSKSLQLDERKALINKALSRLDKRIYIIIDDIDRLKPDEILDVFKLLRNNANFNNIVYIIPYDRDYVIRSLASSGIINAEKYPEKIFEVIYDLPIINTDQIISYILESLLIRIDDEEDRAEIRKSVLSQDYNEDGTGLLIPLIQNIRIAKRFINMFVVLYDNLKGDVCLDNLLNVALLRVLYPSVFELFTDKHSDFLVIDHNQESYVLIDEEKKKSIEKETADPFRYPVLKEHLVIGDYLNSHLEGLSIKNVDVHDVIKILRRLFPRFGRYKDENRINRPDKTARYFIRELTLEDIATNDFMDIWNLPNDEFKENMLHWIPFKEKDLVNKIEDMTPVSVEEQKKRIGLAMYISNRTKVWKCENVKLAEQLKTLKESYTEHETFLSEVSALFLSDGSNLFAYSLLHHMHRDLPDVAPFKCVSEIDDIMIELFKLMLRLNPDRHVFFSFYHESKVMTQTFGEESDAPIYKRDIIPAINQLLKEYIYMNPEVGVKYFIGQLPFEKDLWTLNGLLEYLYDGKEGLYAVFEMLEKSETAEGQELYDFWTKFKNASYKPVSFTFDCHDDLVSQ